MEIFRGAKAVRLRSHHEKYLVADEDEEHVAQDRDGSSPRARWEVELPAAPDTKVLRLKSCYGRYLTASNEPFLLGFTGHKVVQTLPACLDSSLEWEPLRERQAAARVRLKTRYGNFLRANRGLPPYRKSVTHDIPSRTVTQDWVLWDVDVVEIRLPAPEAAVPISADPPLSSSFESSPSSPRLSHLESSSSGASFTGSPPKLTGRAIYYTVANNAGEIDEMAEEALFNFSGTSVEELAHKLQEETGLTDIIVCFKNPLNGTLNPLFLHLPPNKTEVHVVVVLASSKVAKSFKRPEHFL